MISALAALIGLVIGFVAGLCAYRSSRRWCGGCGGRLTCRACADPTGAVPHVGPPDRNRSKTRSPGRRHRNTGPVGA